MSTLPGPEAATPVFVYGTLRFPDVLRKLLGRVPESSPAVLPGWRPAALDGRPYPGLVPAEGEARGLLLRDLGPGEYRTLDEYEGPEYERRLLPLEDGSRAWAYVWTGDLVLDHDWCPDTFARQGLATFLGRFA
ncbi:gamma-glutamylcyclotransferase family protein [Streptomyces sp. NPDC005438]|uniref:gamma-glutamylcyclotransferase family protein n=1 Tax=Streptomyces sp. NPDC005438 TaxID=3156880 RepID=UPI0033BB0CEB